MNIADIASTFANGKIPMLQKLKLLPYANLRSNELTPANLAGLADVFGLKLDPESVNVRAISQAMRDGDASTVADVLQRPELLARITGFLENRDAKQEVWRSCKVCALTFPVTIDKAAESDGFAEATCPSCESDYRVTPDGLEFQ